MDLADYFDRVICINLKRRADRLASFHQELAEKGWPFRKPTVFEAIDYQKVPVSLGWAQGGGAHGCRQSHIAVLQSALMDDVHNLLVLEDDLCMRSSFIEECEKFFAAVPKDWDQLMLGGQHMTQSGDPPHVAPGIVRCLNCQRTHAYAIHGRMMRDLYALWNSPGCQTHIDHVMGPIQGRYRVYAPDPFLFGQTRSQSDISGRLNPTKFWMPPTGNEEIVVLDCPSDVVKQLRGYGIHTGYERDPVTDIDVGLINVFEAPPYEPALRRWITDLQWECVSGTELTLGIWHPMADSDMVRRCWKGPVKYLKAQTLEEALRLLPNLKRVELLARQYVILLRADRQAVGMLRALGWHTGNWRDPVSDMDNGLREWEITRKPEKLREVVECLSREAENMKAGVACLWHPALKIDDVRSVTGLQVVEIDATTVEDAVIQWEAAKAAPPDGGST